MKLMVGDKVLLRHTAFKGKHKIQDRWEHTIYEVIEQPFSKIPVFKIKSTESEDIGVKIVHRNLLLPLYPDLSYQTGEPDNNRSLVDPKGNHGYTGGNCGECNCQSCA